MSPSSTGWTIFALGALALVIDPITPSPPRVHPLPALIAGDHPIAGKGAFTPDGVYPSTGPLGRPAGLATRGSWVGSDAFEGDYVTGWFQPRPEVTLMVAGYPALAPNRLAIEVRRRDGTLLALPFSGPNPRENWQPWEIAIPADAIALRIHGTDASSVADGWLAFSEPFDTAADRGLAQTFWSLLQVAATTGLALILLYGPGLLWLKSRGVSSANLALAILPGPLMLAALGAVCWALDGWASPATIARWGIGAILGLIASQAAAARTKTPAWPRAATRVVAAGVLLVAVAVGTANLSYGPPGELFGGTISRTLAASGHSDSRISYDVVQVVAHHDAPFSPESRYYFAPWSFASRGPLSGLLAAPIVFAAGADVPAEMPDQPWQPFDRQGFVAYRIAMIVLASLAGWAVFGLAAELMGETWGLVASATALLSPFFVHELYFTWPKLMAAACVLVSFLLIVRRRRFEAGLVLAVGYLFHPLAILSAPFLACWILGDRTGGTWPQRWRLVVRLGAGALLLVGPWATLGWLHRASGGSQDGFLSYFLLADNHPATWASWWSSRWSNFACTFLPFYLLFTNQAHESINSFYGLSDAWVHFSFLYWNTLPFALGLPVFAIFAPALAAAVRRNPYIAFATVIGPAALLIVYWGCADTGLMRQCGHPLFFSALLLAVWALSRASGGWPRFATAVLTHPLFLALRAVDVAWMAFGATLHGHRPDWDGRYGWNDGVSLGITGVCLIGAVVVLIRALRSSTPSEAHWRPRRPQASG